ncbi:MAG: TonB-dependent copper receptor [Pseudomonadota bacterium]
MKLKLIAASVALALGNPAWAVDEALDEVVVTAPHSSQPLQVKTDPKKPRQPVPAHDGADYLKTIPGFSIIRKGGTDGDPVLRGMAGSRLNILLDGEQILGGCGGRMDPPTAYVFPAAYDRITVLKGPQTVLYGPGNSAGTVLFERSIDRAAQDGTHGQASLMLGSYGRNDEMVSATSSTADYYLRADATRTHANDYKDGAGVAVHSRYTRWSGNAALGWTPDDNTRLELTLAKSDGQAAYADRSVDGSKFARDNYGVKFEKQHLGGTLDAVEAQAYYNYVDHVMDVYTLRTGNPASMMAAMNPDRKTTGGRVAGTLQLAATSQLKLGLDAQNNVHTNRSGAAPGYSGDYTLKARTRDAEFKNVGVFAEWHEEVSDSRRVIGGLRADSWQATDFRTSIMRGMSMVMNPTANQTRKETLSSGFLRYEQDATATHTWYAGVGRTTRAPDYWELFNKESLTTASSFNTRSEKTTQLDVGMNYRAGGLSGSVSAFYNKITDFNLIQSNVNKGTTMMANYVTVTRNVDATTYGAEAGVAYALQDNWKLDGSLAYVRGNNDTDGTALGQMPPLELRLGVNYDDKVWSFGALLRAVAAQDRVAVNQGNIAGQDIAATSGFSVFSLNGGWRPNKALKVSAGVDNLFNKTYAEHISRAGTAVTGYTQTTRVNELGRNLWIKGDFAF